MESVFHDRIDLSRVEIRLRRWFPLQPRRVVMAPSGHLHFHPRSDLWRSDYATAPLDLQGLFIHEMAHVWQTQRGVLLPFVRHPFARYRYRLVPGWPLKRYGVEQQAEIIRHAFLLRAGMRLPGLAPRESYEALLRGAFGTGAIPSAPAG